MKVASVTPGAVLRWSQSEYEEAEWHLTWNRLQAEAECNGVTNQGGYVRAI